MPDIYDPFQHWVEEHPDFDHHDQRRAVESQLERDDFTRAWLNGQEELDTFLAFLAQTGIDPYEWIDYVVTDMERIAGNYVFVQDENGLLLPER